MKSAIFSILFLTLAVNFTGCTATTYGNHLKETAALNQETLAVNVVHKLTELYPPAKARLKLTQKASDPFGLALVRLLRERGYAVLEFAQNSKTVKKDTKVTQGSSTKISSKNSETQVEPGSAEEASSLALSYILDTAGSPNMYHLTLKVGPKTISRAYVVKDGQTVAGGYWVRGE